MTTVTNKAKTPAITKVSVMKKLRQAPIEKKISKRDMIAKLSGIQNSTTVFYIEFRSVSENKIEDGVEAMVTAYNEANSTKNGKKRPVEERRGTIRTHARKILRATAKGVSKSKYLTMEKNEEDVFGINQDLKFLTKDYTSGEFKSFDPGSVTKLILGNTAYIRK